MSSLCKCGEVSSWCAITQVQDRLKIRKRGKGPDVMLGRQSFLNCGAYEGWGAGCDGGDPIDLFRFMVKYGLPDESCFTCGLAPFSSGAVLRALATHAAFSPSTSHPSSPFLPVAAAPALGSLSLV